MMNKQISKLLLTTCAFALGMGGQLHAQESETEEASVQDVVVVTGIRGSQTRSLDLKRNATEFVDAISSEEVGKLPDRNIAEALQRVTGVAIQRNRGEGDFVSIRGLPPEFVRGTVNGRTFLSGTESFDSTLEGATASTTGRATNFDILPSELIQTLEVYKSASASDVEGGIGGVVNLETARPMNLGTTVVGTLRGRYSEITENVDPSAFVMGSWTNDSNFGILAGLNYSERSIRQDVANSFVGYYPVGTLDPNRLLDLDADGVADPTQPFVNLSNNPEIFVEDRERITFNATAQWQVSDQTEVVADFLYSNRDLEATQYGVIILDSVAPGFCTGPTTTSGSVTLVQCPSAVVENNTLVSRSVQSAVDAVFTDGRVGEEESINFGLNVSHDLGNNWLVEGDLSFADTDGSLNFARNVFSPGVAFDLPGTIAYTNNGGALIIDGGVPAAVSDPDSYNIRQTELRERNNGDSEFGAKLDFTYDNGDSAISAVKFGVHYRVREKDFVSFFGGDGARSDLLVPVSSIPNSFMRAPSNFLDGDFVGLSPSDLLFPNLDVVIPARAAGFPITLNEDTGSTFNAEVETLAGYLQLDIDTEVGKFPLTGNAGIRVVQTNSDVVGLLQDFDIVERNGGGGVPGGFNEVVPAGTISDFPFSNDYINFLPSLNLKLDVTDEVVARFSYGRTLTRPEFVALAPALNVTNPSNLATSSGNPNLDPFVSDNIDLSLEWYFAEGSALTVSAFHKEIQDFIVDSVATNVTFDAVGFVDNAGNRTQGVTFASVERQDNDGEATISGLEIGYSQLFLSLPEPFDGLGVQSSLTLVDSELENAATGIEQPFLGVSDTSYSVAGFYDKGPIQVRLAYTWRDSFLSDEVSLFGASERHQDEYGQLDFSANYDINDNFSVFLDGVNLTEELERNLSAALGAGAPNPAQVVTAAGVGRRVSFGVRAKF